MQSEKNPSDLRNRLIYGALVGAIVGMIIGTMPQNDPRIALLSMGLCAAIIAALAVVSNSFWESLRAAWELMRIAFWRW
jgi:F0F1-type ATP synthase assembly protein I